MHVYLEFTNEKSSKFWEVTQQDCSLLIRYGKVGAKGRSQSKAFESEAAAQKEAKKLVGQKTRKGYAAVPSESPEGAAKAPDSTTAAPTADAGAPEQNDAVDVDADGNRWVPIGDGSYLALIDGRLTARNKKGRRLKAPSKKAKSSAVGVQLTEVLKLQREHAKECRETVERWMLRSLPVPTNLLLAIWPDPAWRAMLEHTVVAPAPGSDEAQDPDLVGLLRAIDAERGLGLVNLDGETVWMKPASVVIPHPILLEDLADWVDMATDLGVVQGLSQLLRETFALPDGLVPTAMGIDTYAEGSFKQLRHAISRTRAIGCRVSGGFATTTVWEGGEAIDAQYWIGAHEPTFETTTGALSWSQKGSLRPVIEVPPVAFSEGMRMASLIFAKRHIEEQEEQA